VVPVQIEALEPRVLASASTFASIDGSGHNLANPQWGSVNVKLLRKAAAAYADGISAPAGANRASARAISNLIHQHGDQATPNRRGLSELIYVWGQFIDHDIDLTGSADPVEAFDIAVPTGDAFFDPLATGTQVISLTRSLYDTSTGTDASNPRQQINQITAWIDGSAIYGSDQATAYSLRTFSGGRLKTSDGNLLPMVDGFFVAGDIRVNENPQLIGMQTLWVREHNRIAGQIAQKSPTFSDEQVYQLARQRVTAEVQAITYNEFLPALLGTNALRPYRGYQLDVNPGIANEFSTAAYRLGHSMLDDDVEFMDNSGQLLAGQEVPLAEAFFNPGIVVERGVDTLFKALASLPMEEVDTQIVDTLRNFLFGPPGAGGLDLASLNIQRGRDHGLADYNTTRAAYGLPRVTSFSQITRDAQTAANLQQAYGSVDNIDLWVGLLSEDHVPGASVGPLTGRIIADQFTRLRDGDRLYYENVFRGRELQELRQTRLSAVIARNTGAANLQGNAFFTPPPRRPAPPAAVPPAASRPAPPATPANPPRQPLASAAAASRTGGETRVARLAELTQWRLVPVK
jgi:hypothetical protein